MPRALPRYEITFTRRGADSVEFPAETQVRRAIRTARSALRAQGTGWQVTVRGWQPGDTSKRGRIEYQAHLSTSVSGKVIVVEER